jgi:hypothetical protein
MTLVKLLWSNTSAQDVHLLPGLASPELTRLLRAGDLKPATNEVIEEQLHNMTGLTVTFSAQLAGTLASHGLAMADKTGEISVDANVPLATKGHSFLVTATAKQGTATASTRIRVYVHGAILRLWLTPARLTVRKGTQNMRLSVLAMFDDGVIGDITNWSPFEPPLGPPDHTYVHPAGSDAEVFTWKGESIPPGGASPVGAHPETGVLDATSAAGSAKITVQGLGRSASATAVCAPPWSTPVKLNIVAGPGHKDMDVVPNLLFLPEGFKESEKPEFLRQVRRVVVRWSLRNRTRPFSSFNGRFNYFTAWVPSPDSGVTVLEELNRARKEPPPDTGESVTQTSVGRPPHTGNTKWSLPGLVNEIGLPTPVGDLDGSPLSDTRIQAWQGLYGTFVTRDRIKDVYAKWLAQNDRVLLNELDTAFHRAFGERPTADEQDPMQALVFNPRRLHLDDFKTFLDALTGPGGQILPKVWTTGKDNDLVVVICRSSHVGGVTTTHFYAGTKEPGHTVAVSLGENDTHRLQHNPHDDGWDLVPDPFPSEPHYSVWLTASHELGHACGLGEEYSDHPGTATPEMVIDAAGRANNQAHTTLLNAAGELSPDNIRWRFWPRIAKAAALLGDPLPTGGKFRIDLQSKPSPGFAAGDVVRLRTRPLARAAKPSGYFKVDSVDAAGLSMMIVPLPPTVADPATFPKQFPKGSIVMVPVRARDGEDLGMVSDDVIVRIALTNNPLNAQPGSLESPPKPPGDDVNRPCPNVTLPYPTPATNWPGGFAGAPKPPLLSSWTIGLYENANRFNCGIYRPTGVCIMNTGSKVAASTVYQYEYCQICRYAIVDHIDPTRRSGVEQDFRDRYEP